MLNPQDRLSGFLSSLLIVGSLAGVLLSFIAAILLVAAGGMSTPWPLSAAGWWAGDRAALKFLSGLGMLILGATPMAMLLAFVYRAIRERSLGMICSGFGLMVILTFGLLLNLLGWVF